MLSEVTCHVLSATVTVISEVEESDGPTVSPASTVDYAQHVTLLRPAGLRYMVLRPLFISFDLHVQTFKKDLVFARTMGTETVETLVAGGKATAAPPLAPTLAPLGVDIKGVVAAINEKTASFDGMQVPVKVVVDTDTKEFEITVGTPPASALIKKEAGIEKGSGRQTEEFVADLAIEQVIKIAQMKEQDLHGKTPKARVKEIVGTCNGMGVKVTGKHAKEAMADIEAGKFDKEITEGKTELSEEEKKKLEAERKAMQEELKKKHAEQEQKVQEILDAAKESNATNTQIRQNLAAAGITDDVIDKVAPKSKAAGDDPKPEA